MFLEIILAIVLGVASGIFTGLTPGIHINLISAILTANAILLLQHITPFPIIIFILSMSLTHTFLDSIPSIYLGAPDADMILAALPGHQMVLEGKGHVAILLTVIGGFGGLILSLFLFPFIFLILKPFADIISNYIAYILIGLLFFLFLREKKRFTSFAFFVIAGILGFTIFALPLTQPLLPTLSGFFGVSLLVSSLFEKSSFPKQIKRASCEIKNRDLTKSIALSTIVGFFAAFLPGFGASQAAIYASLFQKNASKEIFLILSGAINTIAMILSLTTFIVLAKARNGSIIAVSEFSPILTTTQILIVCIVLLVVGSCATILAMRISHFFQIFIQRISYTTILVSIISILVVLTMLFDGYLGLLVLLCTTAFGFVAQKQGISKHYLLGCLLIPTILYLI